MKQALTAVGKSLLIVTGVGYGIVKAFDVLADEVRMDVRGEDVTESTPTPKNEPKSTEFRNVAPACSPIVPPAPQPQVPPPHPAVVDDTFRRLNAMDDRLIRIEKGLESLLAPVERPAPQRPPARTTDHFVTHAELTAAMEQSSRRFEAGIERRFEVQDRSVQALRTMIARTDELLEQVIENIESMRMTA